MIMSEQENMGQEQQTPTKEQMVAFFKEQVEVKSAQVEVAELNMRLAEARARELEAIAKINHFTSGTKNDIVEHIVTQEDLDNNPEMISEGIKVGSKIGIPKAVYEDFISTSKQEAQANRDLAQQHPDTGERKLKVVVEEVEETV